MVDLETLKIYCDAKDLGSEADGLLEELEVRSVALVERATGRSFPVPAASRSYVLHGGLDRVALPALAVNSVSQVEYRDGHTGTWSVLSPDAYLLAGVVVQRTDGGTFPDQRFAVRVTADVGYDADGEPGPIRQLVMDLVNWQFRAGRKLSLDAGGAPDVGKVPGWDRTISMYRRVLFG